MHKLEKTGYTVYSMIAIKGVLLLVLVPAKLCGYFAFANGKHTV